MHGTQKRQWHEIHDFLEGWGFRNIADKYVWFHDAKVSWKKFWLLSDEELDKLSSMSTKKDLESVNIPKFEKFAFPKIRSPLPPLNI